MKAFLQVLQYLKPYKWRLALYFPLLQLRVLLNIANIALLVPIIQVLFKKIDPTQIPAQLPAFALDFSYPQQILYYYIGRISIMYGAWEALLWICAVMLVVAIFANLIRYFSTLLLAGVRVGALCDMRKYLFNSLLRFPVSFFTSNEKGDILSRFFNDLNVIEQHFFGGIEVLSKGPIMFLNYLIALFVISSELSLLVLLLLPLSFFITSWVLKRLKKRVHEAQVTLGAIGALTEETLQSILLVKSYAAEQHMTDRFSKELNTFNRLSHSVARKYESITPLMEFLYTILGISVTLVGTWLILSTPPLLSVEGFISFIVLSALLLNSVKSIISYMGSVQYIITSSDRLFTFIGEQNIVKDHPEARVIDTFEKSISFENVSFGYDSAPVLQDVNIRIKKNETVALVGPSGSGKTTFTALLQRFYDPVAGVIKLDEIPFDRITQRSLRHLMVLVSQDVHLFNASFHYNISFGNFSATRAQVIEAAKIANAHDFIMATPSGYDTILGEQGKKLSGGQRQRIAIARAVIKDPQILILDEATSALDSVSEQIVQEAMDKVMQNRTCFIIAHRLSTVRHADRIIVLDQGKIIAEGPHDVLVEQAGLYQHLVQAQAL